MTGTRADYPRVKSVLREIQKHPDLILKLIVTGSHLLPEYGNTISEIERDGFDIAATVPMFDEDDSPYGMAKAAARCSDGIADALKKIKPDLFLITVDRVETLATAQTVALMNIPMAHIQGGEITGTVDESIRHAVSKLSQIHFPATVEAGECLTMMGEDPRNVHVVGCPYMDIICSLRYKSKKVIGKKYGLDPEKPWILFTQHPVTTEYGKGGEQIVVTLNALRRLRGVEIISLYSNVDAGGREIMEKIKKCKQFKLFPNIESEDFLTIMKYASVMVGNSSAGIREAPSFELPVVNIGSRQTGRARAANVIDVEHDEEEIVGALKKGLSDTEFRESLKGIVNPYGDGNAAKKIVEILRTVKLTPELVQKRINYFTNTFRRVLVTGGAGCIGLEVVKELVRRGVPVFLFDLPEQIARVEKYIPKEADIYYGSVLDMCSIRDAMAGCDGIIHLGAYLGVRRTETNRLRCIEININGTRNVLECAVQHRVKKIVFASSSEVYGEPFENPITEKTPVFGKTVYAITKLAGEELCKAYAQRYPFLKYTVLRYFNTYGPFQIAQFVIPKFIRNVMSGKSPIIYGNGKQKRSYCYVSDTAWATVEALMNGRADGETINIGNSKEPLSLKQLANVVISACGREGELVPKMQQEFHKTDRTKEREIFVRYCDTSKAKNILGYVPRVSVEEGIKKVMKYGVIFPKWATTDYSYTIDEWL